MTSRTAVRVAGLQAGWRRRGHDLALGIGIALGFATLGRIGFEGRFDYGAVGSVVNLAARLCGEAQGGQILLAERAYAAAGAREGRAIARGADSARASLRRVGADLL